MRFRGACIGLAVVAALALPACASAEQPQAADDPAVGGAGSMAAAGSAGSAAADEDAAYVNATYGFSFDPSFCDDLMLVDEARDAAVYESESWGMRLYVQGAENVEGYDAQGLADAIALQAEVPDADPVVGKGPTGLGYCTVQQLERDFQTGDEVVVTYMLYVGSGNWQGLVAEFDPKTYETLTAEQAVELGAAFMPGDLNATHDELRQDADA